MEWSKYNYIYHSSKHGYLLFNTLSGTFLDINNDSLRSTLFKIKENINEFDFSNKKKFKDLLLSSAIICERDTYNTSLSKFYALLGRFDGYERILTILPTLNCNLACPYCYEGTNLRNDKMNVEVIAKLKDYIKEQYYQKIKLLKLQWYGGEPLLAFDVIQDISSYLTELQIPYAASIVTNATLLTKDKIEFLSKLKINEIQVTLDGVKQTHDTKRIYKSSQGTFDVITNNLRILHQYIEQNRQDIKVNIRVNIDKNNKDEYHVVQKFIYDEFPKFVVYPGILMQYTTCSSSIPCFIDQKEVASFYIEQYEKYSVTELQFYPFLKGMRNCMAESPYTDMVGPKGEMYLCLKDVGDKNEEIGSIFSGKTNIHLISSYCNGGLTFDDKTCSDCMVIGLCGGGCANIKYRNNKYQEKNDPCVPYKDMAILEKYLDIHYEIIKHSAEDDE
ncbi:MAG: radical SAM protein [Prevotellaceae bacterium]|jgi:uncharacterized protein|nr:radical SAM protein [Prevotellaceae bacterium]